MAINSTTDIHLAIHQLGLKDNSYSLSQSVPPHVITKWDSNNSDSQPTDDELNAAYTAWKVAEEYKINRANEYPSIEDQLDTIYHSGVAGWKTTIKAIKDKSNADIQDCRMLFPDVGDKITAYIQKKVKSLSA